MSTLKDAAPDEPRDASLIERLQRVIETLEQVALDRATLAHLTAEERTRLIIAAGQVYNPAPADRRRLVKATVRRRKAGRVQGAERPARANRHPEAPPPAGVHRARCFPRPPTWRRGIRRAGGTHRRRAAELLHLQAGLLAVHHFYDQLCPACAELNFAKRTETGGPARARRAADRRARQDRLSGRPQAAARRRAADRHHALPARLRGALRARAGLRRVGRSPGDLRPRSAPHAERRGVLPAPARDARRGSTSSSTTPARRCAARRTSTST